MMRWLLLGLATICLLLLLAPRELTARRTVGDQSRAERQRVEMPKHEGVGPRACGEGEAPSDRDPCVPPGAQFAPSQ